MKNYIQIMASITGAILLVSFLSSGDQGKIIELKDPHVNMDFPDTVNALFAGSGKCVGCHGYDPEGLSSTDEDGNDVNVADAWAATMMANSAKDPFWRAKVSHEVLVNPGHQSELEHTCTSCHAPLGHFNALHNGQEFYSIAEMEVDSMALDGVSCSACHQQDTTSMGTMFSGNIIYDTTKTIFGQYENPFFPPMQGLVGFDVVHSDKMITSLVCASCHTLITATADLDGNPSGDEFVEQATYHEWQNSIFDQDETRQECQACHTPRIDDEVALALDYSFVGGRSPFGKHEFSGANIYMLKLMKDNIDSLGINASLENYDSTIVRTERMLRDCTLTLELNELNRTSDSVYYALKIINRAGHKFPSGYPSRRATVQFIVKNDNGDTLFFNGAFDEDFEVIGHDSPYEPHHQMINNEEDVQIYEMVFSDINGDKTTILERGYESLKDNRLVPKGFSTEHISYDTVAIIGEALLDPDFNYENEEEGSGSDVIYFTVALEGYNGALNTRARIFYQTAPPAWMEEMFSHSSTEIDRFKDMFDASDRSPFLVAETRLDSVSLGVIELEQIKVELYPNPSLDGFVFLHADREIRADQLRLFDASGRAVAFLFENGRLTLPMSKGIYYLQIHFGKEQVSYKKILRY